MPMAPGVGRDLVSLVVSVFDTLCLFLAVDTAICKSDLELGFVQSEEK